MPCENDTKPSPRPVNYTREIASIICDRLFEGKTLREICGGDAALPALATVLRWLCEHEEFRNDYSMALAAQAEDLLYETVAIADDVSGDVVERLSHDGNVITVFDRDNLRRSKLRCDIRHWV